ncbi:glycosyltransferase family 2 protein, partial [Methanoculleus sp. MH98A]|uniref:glycosyltransferase n=1 Tax=Methanoculleus sp. MH98A TaxID=1495314 RepID=UPI0012DDA6E3
MIHLDTRHNGVEIEAECVIASIIIPAHNEEMVLGECLNSIIDVDFPRTQYEIIIVDDGSTDRTSDIATLYQTKYENVIALSKPNGGKASAQNHGLRSARGKYVLVTDADAVVNRDWVS